MDLFHFQEIAPGMVFWHPKGWMIYQVLEQYMRERLADFGYQEIKTPQLVDKVFGKNQDIGIIFEMKCLLPKRKIVNMPLNL